MDTVIKVFSILPWGDWAALAAFFIGWSGYAWFAKDRAQTRPSVLATTNRYRRLWMMQTTYRDVRVIDGVVIQNLSTSPSFFASTTILLIGGLLAALSAGDKASDLVRDIPFAARTSVLIFELKLVLLLVIFVYAFFRFTWSMRQYTFGALMIAAAPEAKQFEAMGTDGDEKRRAFADKAGRVVGLAAETFNDGLRAYYMSFAVTAWFFSPWAYMAATAFVIFILYRREFHSEVVAALNS